MINKQYYKTLYAIVGKYGLQSTSYNPHYMIYKNKKNAEKRLEKLKRLYANYKVGLLKDLAEHLRIVEYKLVEDNTDEQ